MKKSLFIFLLSILAALGCNDQLEGYIIGGSFRNAAGYKAILSRTVGQNLQMVDSATINTEGKFEFKGKLPYSEFFLLSVVSPDGKVTQNIQLLVGNNDLILLEGDVAGDLKTNYTIAGSRESIFVQELNTKLMQTTQQLDSVAKLHRQALQANTMDSATQARIDQANRAIVGAHRKYSEAFIAKHDSSLLCVMALFQSYSNREPVFSMEHDMPTFEHVLARMEELNPQSELTKTLRMYILAYKNRQTPQQDASKLVSVGMTAPEIALTAPSGREVALSALRGNYVLLDFWAGWCRPCRQENPNLVRNYRKYHARGFEIFQVSLDKTRESWFAAIRADRLSWIHGSDLMHWESPAAKLYNVQTIPANFLIDPQGRIVAINLRGDALGRKLQEVYGF